jgi:hypothetical protein
MRPFRIAVMLIAIGIAAAASAQSPPKPLFASNDMLRLTIRGPINQITRSDVESRKPRDAELIVPGAAPETLPIQLSPRGITRLKREVCQFPPLRVRFLGTPGPGSIFTGQTQLKLVTHCRPATPFQQHLLLEYAAYRLYNQLTPASFRVRLATIDYVDQANRPITSRYGFFIEDIDDVASRNAMRRANTPDRVPRAQLNPADGARVALFQYMIGNLDWSMRAGPAGEGCCHNSRLLARPAGGPLTPVPYDFDYSGLVDAPYAVAPDGSSGVRNRKYQGYCAHNSEALAMAAAVRAQRAPLMSVLNEVPLGETVRQKASSYLTGFIADIADDGKAAAKVLKTCVK